MPTIIELEDYEGNTIALIDIEAEVNETQITIKGFVFADCEEENWYRFQRVE